MKKISSALLLLSFCFSMAQESVLLRLNYFKGDKYGIEMNMNMDMSTQNINMKFDLINEVVSDTNEYIIASTFSKVKMDMSIANIDEKMSYDSSTPLEKMTPFAQAMHEQMKPIFGLKIQTFFNNRGFITKEAIIEGKITGMSDTDVTGGMMEYPEKPIQIGDSWSEIKSNKGVDSNTNYTLKEINDKYIVLDAKGTLSKAATGSFSGVVYINKSTGIPYTTNYDFDMVSDGVPLKMKISTKMIQL